MSFLFTGGNDPTRESRRITLGLVGLGVISVVLLNFGIYQSAQNNLVKERWDQLAQTTDTKRDQMRILFQNFERQTRYVAEQAPLRRRAQAALAGTLSDAERGELDQELERAASVFGLHHLALVAPDGTRLAPSDGGEDIAFHGDLARRAAQTRETVVADIHAEANGSRALEVAIPLVGDSGDESAVPVLLAAASADEGLIPLLRTWDGFGDGAHAYLVRQQGGEILYLTTPDARTGAPAPPVPMTSIGARAAAMAAAGVESNLELIDARGRAVCATTRFLPELGWGLVGQMDRDVMMADMRVTLAKLLLIDLVLLLGTVLTAWLWRRQYARGLARHEVAVTHRHAARVQAIFDTAFDAILTFDRAGRVRTVNRAAEKLFGRAAAEMDGLPLQRFLHWGVAATASPTAAQPLPTPGVVTIAEALRADGEAFPAEFSLGQAGEGDDLLYTAIVRDISERVEAEKRIHSFAEGLEVSNRRLEEANAQLEEASRLKSEFLANTSHELRTPLNGMIGFLQLVLDGMCESEDEERDFLKQALQCSRHLLGLINDVLDIAKIESGKLTLEISRVDIESLFGEVHTVTHVQAAQKGIALRFEAPPGDVRVRCDFAKTKQVIINLVGNSLKFTPKGTITVRAVPHAALGHIMFEVVDTGIGIPKEQQKVIFEKFAQGDGSTTRKYGGTGLGLAISRSLVEVQGGVIGVQSEGAGRGTRLYFSLPLWNEEAHAVAPESDAPSEAVSGPAGGALVLVVEDDPVFRRFLVAVLHQYGYRTVEALHAEAGWVLARRVRPACVVLDYALSCHEGAVLRTGWDLAERMTTDPATRRIPLIFVTGFDLEVKEKMTATAFSRKPEHLMKPVDGKTLVARIQELVGEVTGRAIRVLMADDDASVAAFVRAVLPEPRFQLEVTTNGEECLHLLRTRPRGFDLLLLDLMMPEVSGYDVLREMTLAGTGAETPVLVLTNFPEARNAEEKRLLEEGLVLDVVAKTAVHDNPALLPHLLEWHLQVAHGDETAAAEAA